jgi:hypothetical protein
MLPLFPVLKAYILHSTQMTVHVYPKKSGKITCSAMSCPHAPRGHLGKKCPYKSQLNSTLLLSEVLLHCNKYIIKPNLFVECQVQFFGCDW